MAPPATWHTGLVTVSPVQALIIPVDATFRASPALRLETLGQTEAGGLAAAIHRQIGDWFQVVGAPHGANLYLDEEGKFKELDENIRRDPHRTRCRPLVG